ncbi:MAG: OmpH family outer membrane protein [Syntrophobacteraceae bacterium]
MKRFFGCVLVAAGITLAFSVNAVAAGGSLKIGFFDLQAAIIQSDTGKKFLEEMKKEETNLNSALEQKGSAFMTAKDEYDKKKNVMDEKARGRKEKELSDMYTELQKMRSESSTKFKEQASAARAPILKKVRDVAKKIGRDEKYDFIIEKSSLYFEGNEKDDLTKRVSAELDKSSSK